MILTWNYRKLQEFNEAGNEGSFKCTANVRKPKKLSNKTNNEQTQKEQKGHYDLNMVPQLASVSAL